MTYHHLTVSYQNCVITTHGISNNGPQLHKTVQIIFSCSVHTGDSSTIIVCMVNGS